MWSERSKRFFQPSQQTRNRYRPCVSSAKWQISKLISTLEDQFKVKSKELADFQTKFGIRMKGEVSSFRAFCIAPNLLAAIAC